MSEVKPMEVDQSQSQNQQQSQPQQQTQQMIIATHEMQQNVQQQQTQQNQSNQQQSQQQQNQQITNGPQKLQTQVQVQPQVAAIMPQQHDAVAVSMQHQQQSQVGGVSMTLSSQQGAPTITTMATHPQAVQVIQQPMQNQYHLPQLYNAQGTPLLMPGNLALHPAGINPSPIQVQFNNIAGKPFQSAQLTPHMLTTASTTGQGGTHPGAGGAKVQGFPAGYIPVPTSATQGAQTLVFGPLEVLGSQHQNAIQQQQNQQQNSNKDQVQKYTACTTGTASGQRTGGMQFAPWQFATQGIWTAGLQPQTLITAPNQIFIRDPTQPDMFIQSPQPIQAHGALTAQQQIQGVQQITSGGKPRVMNMQQQQQNNKQGVVSQRPLSILPSLQGVPTTNIRPASSVSTQTNHGVQATVHAQSGKAGGGAGKGRGKPVVRTSPGPNAIAVAVTKAVAASQNKTNIQQAMIMQSQPVTVSNSSNNNKVLITTNSTTVATSVQPPGSPMQASVDKQNFGTQNKSVMQTSQQQVLQQQQQVQQQQQLQQVFIQHFQHQQQQHLQQQYQQAQAGQQQIQPKPLMGMTVQQQPQGPQNVVLGSERPIMPVVSINPALIGNQLVGSTHSLQALPIVNQSAEQIQAAHQQLQAAAQQMQQSNEATLPSMPMIISSPERPQQIESSIMSPPPSSTPMIICSTDDSNKTHTTPNKKDPSNNKSDDAMAFNQENNSDESEQKNSGSKNENESDNAKDDKNCNPLINLANAVNSIPNGNLSEETTVLDSIPMSNLNCKQVPPKAMVKPQVLTHVIEGFVIQEASEPFAVNRPLVNGTIMQDANNKVNNIADKENQEDPPSKRKKFANNYANGTDANVQLGKCEACGSTLDEQNVKLKKDKRFCSTACSKLKKKDNIVGDKQWMADMNTDPKNDDYKKNGENKSLVGLPAMPSIDENLPKINPVKWTVGEVCDFIRNLPGCADYAEDFAIQEIDGQALMLLKEDHLMSAMSIKLGPALKIVAKIDSMRVDSMTSPMPTGSL